MSSFPKLYPSTVKIDTLGDLKAEGLGLWFECFGPRPRCPSDTLDLDRLINHFGPSRQIEGLSRTCPGRCTKETRIQADWNSGEASQKPPEISNALIDLS